MFKWKPEAEKKKLDVCIATPTSGIIHAQYAMSITKLVLYYLQTPVRVDEFKSKVISSQMQIGACIGQARDNMAQRALELGCSHLLFIDDDMGFTPDCLNLMLEKKKPVLISNYRRKAPPGKFTAVKPDQVSELFTTTGDHGLEPAFFGGFGFALIEMDVFRQIERPRFLPYYNKDQNVYTTEDRPFFEACFRKGIEVFVDQDVSKRVWHNGSFIYSFDQQLDPDWIKPYPERSNVGMTMGVVNERITG